jgi:hypothetical protein
MLGNSLDMGDSSEINARGATLAQVRVNDNARALTLSKGR